MRAKLMRATGLGGFSIALVLLACAELRAQAADMKLQAFLVWGTDETKPPEGKIYRAVAPDIMRKL
jgi:hypothetical protein